MPTVDCDCPHCRRGISVELPDTESTVRRVTPYSPYAAEQYDTREICRGCGETVGVYHAQSGSASSSKATASSD